VSHLKRSTTIDHALFRDLDTRSNAETERAVQKSRNISSAYDLNVLVSTKTLVLEFDLICSQRNLTSGRSVSHGFLSHLAKIDLSACL